MALLSPELFKVFLRVYRLLKTTYHSILLEDKKATEEVEDGFLGRTR